MRLARVNTILMTRVDSNEIPEELEYRVRDLAQGLAEKLVTKYPQKEDCTSYVSGRLYSMLAPLFLTSGTLKGKKVLDVGCGSRNSWDHYEDGRRNYLYQPWLCRALLELEAYPIGIDGSHQRGEKFESYCANLRNTSINTLLHEPVDIACSFSFFDSPSLMWYGGKDMFMKLLPQLKKIVKERGHFVFEDFGLGLKDEEYLTIKKEIEHHEMLQVLQ